MRVYVTGCVTSGTRWRMGGGEETGVSRERRRATRRSVWASTRTTARSVARAAVRWRGVSSSDGSTPDVPTW
jgi:hypothetical protein